MKDIIIIIFLLLIYSCNQQKKNKTEPTLSKVENEIESQIKFDSLFKNVIIGDFDGDGRKDELNEILISGIDNKSIDSLPHLEYDSLLSVIYKKNPILSLQSNSKNIPELILSKEPSFGLFWLKNEGDLNNDGSDEISIVINWADMSQCNSCKVYSLKKGKWNLYAQFDVREWQIERNPDFNGFIQKNKKKGIYQVATFDSEMNEILKPLNEVLVTHV